MTAGGETPIAKIATYNARMAKSMIDKIYFMDKVEADLFVDYGCADGVMVKALARMFPENRFVGYDILPRMVNLAQENNPQEILFTTDWGAIQQQIQTTQSNGGKTAIVLSSIIHEVYSYCSAGEIKEFWKRVFESGFDYVVIREMMVSRTTSRQSDPISVARIRQCYDGAKLHQWESLWGSINENWSLVHFLLTYRYEEGWEREFRENYLPLNLEDFMPMIPRRYFPTFMEHYTLPYVRKTVEQDFGIQLQDRTHFKCILELRA
jgi:hypothetical protein